MRNLTIKRHKSFVGCAVADQVYIRDDIAGTITIDGVPCRKLGSVKNGKEATFQISDEEQKIFMIADQVSKDYCNASMEIPAGTQDVTLAGKHEFVLGSNPFRFDGQELSDQQKKNKKKGIVIWISSIVVGLAVGLMISNLFFNNEPKEKTFTKEDYSITLTDDFKQLDEEGEFVSFDNKYAYVWVMREDKKLFEEEDLTLEDYAELIVEYNAEDAELAKKDGMYCFAFTEKVDGETYYYFAVCSESEEAFWVTWFGTPKENESTYADKFIQWGKSIKVG